MSDGRRQRLLSRIILMNTERRLKDEACLGVLLMRMRLPGTHVPRPTFKIKFPWHTNKVTAVYQTISF